MSEGTVHLHIAGSIAWVTFDRPAARNAMTWAMYEQLTAICDQLAAEPTVRAACFRGVGGEAFVAGTDIAQFEHFQGGDDGVAYERRIDACVAKLAALPMPTLAVLEGWAVGGGLAIAATCDLRIATPGTRLGVPIARTLGNCLSAANVARLVASFGRARVQRMLLLADWLEAREALDCGWLTQIVEPAAIDDTAARLCGRLASLAPVTQRVSKQLLERLLQQGLPDAEDLIRTCYGSEDFREGVQAFAQKRPAAWTGR